jgi:hypothetical protein
MCITRRITRTCFVGCYCFICFVLLCFVCFWLRLPVSLCNAFRQPCHVNSIFLDSSIPTRIPSPVPLSVPFPADLTAIGHTLHTSRVRRHAASPLILSPHVHGTRYYLTDRYPSTLRGARCDCGSRARRRFRPRAPYMLLLFLFVLISCPHCRCCLDVGYLCPGPWMKSLTVNISTYTSGFLQLPRVVSWELCGSAEHGDVHARTQGDRRRCLVLDSWLQCGGVGCSQFEDSVLVSVCPMLGPDPHPVPPVEDCYQEEAGNWELNTASWELETGHWKLGTETGSWKRKYDAGTYERDGPTRCSLATRANAFDLRAFRQAAFHPHFALFTVFAIQAAPDRGRAMRQWEVVVAVAPWFGHVSEDASISHSSIVHLHAHTCMLKRRWSLTPEQRTATGHLNVHVQGRGSPLRLQN